MKLVIMIILFLSTSVFLIAAEAPRVIRMEKSLKELKANLERELQEELKKSQKKEIEDHILLTEDQSSIKALKDIVIVLEEKNKKVSKK